MASKRLAKMVTAAEASLIDITAYLTFRKNEASPDEVLTILTKEEAEKLLDEPSTKDQVEIVNSKWAIAGWFIQNDIVEKSQEVNQFTGKKEVNWKLYRDLRIKNLLKKWDLDIDGKEVPVTEEYIKNTPAEVVLALYNTYEKAVAGDPLQEGKS
jgi:hypothetical protein